MAKTRNRVVALVVALVTLIGMLPTTALASIPNWADNNVVYNGETFGTDGYYNVISKKDYVLVPGAAVESEIVLNNASGNRRQVLHVIEVDPSNPDVSIVPGYYQIDKDLEDEANWSHKELTEMAKYYEDNLGYNIVGGMNTDLYYNSYSPRVLVYNGKWIGNAHENVATGGAVLNATSSILYVFKDAKGNVSCDVKAYNKAEVEKYLAEGTLLHAVGVSFGMVVKDGELVSKTVSRGSDDAARSMVGVKEDGTLVLVMNDGRGANNSVGFSSYEEGEAMLALGCKWAANCDGGGSSTFISKRVGEEDFAMRSVPCDGAQRPTAHGIFIASNVAPTGVLDVVNVESEYDIFAPKTVYTFGAEAIDTHGYALDMPADATWALSDASFGTIANGKFVSNGKTGTVDIQVISGGKVVGSKTITVADPAVFKLSATSTVVPYSTADKIRTIKLPIVAMTGEANVYVDTNAVSVTLSNNAAGTLDGFSFTATDDTSIEGVNVTITYGDKALTYAIEFGKGSEIIWDFEDGDKAGFMGFEEAKKWSQDNGVNNTLVGTAPLAGQFNEYLSSKTFVSSTTNGGQVRNGNYALAWRLDNTDAAFASWSYNVLFNTDEVIVFRDVANGKKATTLGMWLYIPENAFPAAGKGLAFQSQFNSYANWAIDGKASCVQDHFVFTSAATGKQTNLNSATNADIPESRWVYATIDISKYDYLSTMPATNESNSRSPSFIRTYVKPDTADVVTFYIDDITLDYSSAVDDRVLPTITNTKYGYDENKKDLINGATIDPIAGLDGEYRFYADVADNAALDYQSGKIYIDGVEVPTAVDARGICTQQRHKLLPGTHTVAFEIKDELGNPMKITRTFTVAGDAAIELGGHNDSGETPKAQSVYYVDINVAKLADVNKLVAVLKLNNSNKWETKGAIVANGFEVTLEYNEISELLTVTVERTGSVGKVADNTLVSIPVRVWTYDRYDYVNNKDIAFGAADNKPVVNIDCEVVYGVVDGSYFSGSVHVATELKTTSSPYHVHDTELSVLNKDATTAESGYENRTYCETCKSVVDWGTIIPKIEITHNYQIVDGKFVCSDEGCGEVYASGTGIFEMNGSLYYSINGILKTGWQSAADGYCYASSSTYKVYAGVSKVIGRGTYTFDENGILQGGAWVTTAKGTVYSYGPACYTRTWAEIDGKTYYFGSDSYMYTGIRFVKDNPDVSPVWYDFGADGATDKNVHPADGVYEVNGDYYVVKDGVTQTGLHYVNGAYYLGGIGSGFDRAGACAKNSTHTITAAQANGLLPAGTYSFGADGKMILKNGLVEEGGKLYYYENGARVKKGAVKIGGDIYYFSMKYYALEDGRYSIEEGMTNGLFPAGYYYIEDYKVQMKNGMYEEGGKLYYYVNNVKVKAGAVKVGEDIYYFGMRYYALDDGRYEITEDMTNGLFPAGYYYIEDYKVQMKNGVYEEGGKLYYYVDNVKQKAGAVQIGDDIYYFSMKYYALDDGRYYIDESMTNGLLPAGYYVINDYKIQMKNGIVEESGKLYYYVDNQKMKAGAVKIGDEIYYFSLRYHALEDGRYYIEESMMNGLLPGGYYQIKDHKIVVE